jgi:membrane protein YdbS with pleckstrin-like domain
MKPVVSTTTESTVWRGTPSQMLNFWTYVLCIVTSPLVVPLFILIWKWIELRCRVYEVTTERIQITTGVFSRQREEIELYRVKDTSFAQPFWMRIFGLGNITLHTSDARTPVVVIPAISEAEAVRNQIRGRVEALRSLKGVRELDTV